MAWWGTGIGAGIGMMLGGPFGALIGAGIGSSMTREERGYSSRVYEDRQSYGESEQKQIGFLVATFSMLGKIAKADGSVSEDEIAFIKAFIKNELELDANSRRIAIEIFNRAKSDATPIDQYAAQLSEVFPHDDAMRETIYRVLFNTAMADGHLHPAEKEILQRIPRIMRLRPNIYQDLASELGGDLDGSYALLGCAPDASDQAIKSAYRKKCMEYHPDKLASKGLPEGFTKFANDQMQQFSDAYEKIVKQRRKNN